MIIDPPSAPKRRRHAKVNRGPTLRDVARAAAVSTASVSRALSRPDLVSEAVHDRVMTAMLALAYVPNAAARALSGRPARLIGAVVATLDDPSAMHGLESLARELATSGAALMLSVADAGQAASMACARDLMARGAEAVVFWSGATPLEPGDLIPGRSVLCATFDEAVANAGAAGSGFDCARALALGARYLQALGHVKIALVGVSNRRRVDALRDALAGTGIEIVDDLPAKTSIGSNPVGDIFDRWGALPDPPTAVLCASDLVAVAVLQECKRRQIAVPGQLSVIGFGDTELSRQAQPALSSLRVPAREAGRALARGLLAALEGRSEPLQELFAKLVARESIGARRG